MNQTALRPIPAESRSPDGVVSKTHMKFQLDQGIAARGRVGLIVLATDHTIEHEFRQVFGKVQGVALYESRIQNAAEINAETLAAMEKGMAAAAGIILPGMKFDVIAYGCTSGTVVIGEEKVFERIREARPGVACTTPITAAIDGLKKLGAKRIALLTPYVEEVNQMLRRFVEARGIAVPVMGSFNHENDNEVACISQDSIKAGGARPGARAVGGWRVRLLHVLAGGRYRRGAGERAGQAGDLQQPRAGLALPAAGGVPRAGAGVRAAVQGLVRLTVDL